MPVNGVGGITTGDLPSRLAGQRTRDQRGPFKDEEKKQQEGVGEGGEGRIRERGPRLMEEDGMDQETVGRGCQRRKGPPL